MEVLGKEKMCKLWVCGNQGPTLVGMEVTVWWLACPGSGSRWEGCHEGGLAEWQAPPWIFGMSVGESAFFLFPQFLHLLNGKRGMYSEASFTND